MGGPGRSAILDKGFQGLERPRHHGLAEPDPEEVVLGRDRPRREAVRRLDADAGGGELLSQLGRGEGPQEAHEGHRARPGLHPLEEVAVAPHEAAQQRKVLAGRVGSQRY